MPLTYKKKNKIKRNFMNNWIIPCFKDLNIELVFIHTLNCKKIKSLVTYDYQKYIFTADAAQSKL